MSSAPTTTATPPALTTRLVDLASLALLAGGIAALLLGMLARNDRAVVGPVHASVEALVTAPDAAVSHTAEPLVAVKGAPAEPRSSRVFVCLESADGEEDFLERLDGIEVVWRDAAGAALERRPLDEPTRAPRYGLDRRCSELEAVTLDSPGAYALGLVGELDLVQRDALRETRVVAMAIDADPFGWPERAAVITLLLAMLLRLWVWQLRPAPAAGDAPQARWMGFDPLIGIAAVIVLSVLVANVLPGGRDPLLEAFFTETTLEGAVAGVTDLGPSSRLTLALLLANVGVYVGVALGMARWRSAAPSAALRATRSTRFGLARPFFGGIALAFTAMLLLAHITPDTTSPMQWMTAVPGTMLATAAMACLSPWFEELFFRGFLFGSIEGVAGRVWAAVISAGLFALFHVPQHLGFLLPLVPILAVTLVATWLRYASGSTTPGFALHLGYNMLLVLPALFGS